eukprot:366365-Pelagomonas_calceolata.AAC.1
MWIGWVSGSTLLQGTNVMMSVYISNGTSGRGSCLAGIVLLLNSLLHHILRSTWSEGGVDGLFGLAGQGVTKIASGRLE